MIQQVKQMLTLFVLVVLMASCQFNNSPEVHTDPESGITYQWFGSGDTTLVFVHGWCADKTYWEKQSTYFKDNYKVLLLNLPGLGLSETTDNTDYGNSVPKLLYKIIDQPAVLVGHSLGVDIVLQSIEPLGDKVLKWVVVDDFKSLDVHYTDEEKKEIEKIITNLKNNFYRIGVSFAEESLLDKNSSQELYKKVIDDIKIAHPETAAIAMKRGFDFNEKRQHLLKQIKKRVYVIQSNYVKTDSEALSEWGVPYKIHEINDGGHFPMFDNSTQFNAILSEIIKE